MKYHARLHEQLETLLLTPDFERINQFLHQEVSWCREGKLFMNTLDGNDCVYQVQVANTPQQEPLWLVLLEKDAPLLVKAFAYMTLSESDKQKFTEVHRNIAMSKPEILSTALIQLIHDYHIKDNLYFVHPTVLEHFVNKNLTIGDSEINQFVYNMYSSKDSGLNGSKNTLAILDFLYQESYSSLRDKLISGAWEFLNLPEMLQSSCAEEVKFHYIKMGLTREGFSSYYNVDTRHKREQLQQALIPMIIEHALPGGKERSYELLKKDNNLFLLAVASEYFDKEFLLSRIDPEMQTAISYFQMNKALSPSKTSNARCKV